MNPQGRVALLLSNPFAFQGLIKKPYSENPRTFGDHLKRARLMYGLKKRNVAALIGANIATIINWEKGRTKPPVPSIPAIIAFL